MSGADLRNLYRDYIACLNERAWSDLGLYVHEQVIYNGEQVDLSGYREMLDRNVQQIPDLRFQVALLAADPPYVASRLQFDCRPKARFLDLDVNGKRVSFSENVFYKFRDDKIVEVWSVIDKAALQAQL